jgi:CBS domain-containing protein
MKKCGELMTRRLTLLPETASVLDVARLMREQRIGLVPICQSGSGVLLGVVTERDLVIRLCAEDRKPSEVPLSEVMMLHPPYCLDDSDILAAEEAMIRHQASRLIVVNLHRQPVGVLGMTTVLRALRRFGRTPGAGRSPLPPA